MSGVAKHLGCETYFATPYHSWERGQNENANGLLRQYFPKSMKLNDVGIEEVFKAAHKLNSRPRKCLGYKTPYESFEQHTGVSVQSLFGFALMGTLKNNDCSEKITDLSVVPDGNFSNYRF